MPQQDPHYFSIYRTAKLPDGAEPWSEILADKLQADLAMPTDDARKLVYPAKQTRLTILSGKELSIFYTKTGIEPGHKQTAALQLALGKALCHNPDVSPYATADLTPLRVRRLSSKNEQYNAFVWAYGSSRAATERHIAVHSIQRFFGLTHLPRGIFGIGKNKRYLTLAHVRSEDKLPAAKYLAHILETQQGILPAKIKFDAIKMNAE